MNFLKHAMFAITLILISMTAMAVTTPEIEGVPDITIPMNAEPLVKFVDLRDYARDDFSSAGNLFYRIQNESNVNLVDCFIEDDYYVSCEAPKRGVLGTNTITVQAVNSKGTADSDEFNVKVFSDALPEDVIFSVDRDKVVIEPNDSINVVLTIENQFPERKCFELYSELDNNERDDIRATPAKDSFCLNGNERTSLSMTITSFDDARVDLYDVDVILDYGQGSRELSVDVEIVDLEEPLELFRTSDYYVCRTPYTQEIGIRLENNSSRYQEISLNAEHELLLPEFEYFVTRLAANAYDEMVMRIHVNQTTALTDYTIPVFIRSENYFVERDIKIRLIDCEDNAFDLDVTPNEQRIERGDREFYTVILTSVDDEAQDVRLSVDSDLPTSLERYDVYLPAYGEVKLDLEVRARESDDDGTHRIKVTAWNSKETEEETVKAIVESEHILEMIIENNDFDARICSATSGQVFEARILNKGDFDETVTLTLAYVPESVQAVLSEDEIDIEAGGEKIVYVFINPSFGTPLGNYTLTLIAESDNDELREQLRFKVVEAEQNAIEGVIEITSYPREVVLVPGEEKLLSFTIKNSLSGRMDNVRLRFFGANNGVTVFPMSLGSLEGGESITVNRKIKASESVSEKVYDSVIEVRADGYVTTVPMRIKITETPEEEIDEEAGLLAGFAVLGGGEIILGGVIIIILLLAIIVVLSLLNSNESKGAEYLTENRGA
ncbi:MAG: hypothetical protein CL944_02985 [Candidatus Diapherotrites archaeon]|uniref:Uncharacterized protein n=1 Tax=Candidatus Iainarchaeum sp. TaxID=3101447 RepID=A0A2D6LQC0_9ARCH|nr:hypothetical protein [Candidatus Diapherotrites archaeon]|tara:strand:- start:3877 stop:6048 length:2172 start_codon:yes stop_codon:yes gene_type:complete